MNKSNVFGGSGKSSRFDVGPHSDRDPPSMGRPPIHASGGSISYGSKVFDTIWPHPPQVRINSHFYAGLALSHPKLALSHPKLALSHPKEAL